MGERGESEEEVSLEEAVLQLGLEDVGGGRVMCGQKEDRCMGEEEEPVCMRPCLCVSQCRDLGQPAERLSRPG